MSASVDSQSSVLGTLRDVLLLEQKRGYDDRAVVGGLGAFVGRAVKGSLLDVDLVSQIRLYAEQSPAEREASVTRMLSTIEEMTDRRRSADQRTGSLSTGATSPGSRPSRLVPGTPVAAVPGVGSARAKRLAALGITTIEDLRLHLPHRYVAYPPPQLAAELGFQHLASFEGVLRRVDVSPLPGKRFRITAVLGDTTGSVAAIWIRSGRVPANIQLGARLAVSGPLVRYGRQVYFENPEYEPADHLPLNTRHTVPVYPLTAGLSQPLMRAIVRRAVAALPPMEEGLPDVLRRREGLLGRHEALEELHWPTSEQRLDEAQRRFAFDELLPIHLLVLQRRLAYQATPATPIAPSWSLLAEFRRQLPFALTGAQQRVLSAILEDMARPRPMIRLLQGEVGSGKTVVAAMVLLAAMAGGGQAAIMAPTEVLAEQHLRTLTGLYERAQGALDAALGRPLRIVLLSGALSRGERERTLASIVAGEVDLAVGTHAVIQSDVEFARLVLAVVDEQHRFGVSQRVAVRRKGENPHLLVMTATPIPRTLALTLYGDLDISLIDELPPGRPPVETTLLRPMARARAYDHIRSEVAAGHQAFVICPLVEGSEATEARAATTEYERLRSGELAGTRLALLHGRMRSSEKDSTMRQFALGEHDVLVSTSVVEVGVDVPNATVMVIEGAERFGLAQLHQFRGRVGRGTAQATCFLIAGTESPESLERLEAVVRSSNGLELAEKDLQIRGPGDSFGLRQSGFPALHVARMTDLDLIQQVREVAARLLEDDPNLERAEHAPLAEAVRRLGQEGGEAN